MKTILLRTAIYVFCCTVFNTAWSEQTSANSESDDVKEAVVDAAPAPLTLEQQLLQLQKTLSEKEKEKKTLGRKLRTVKDETTKEQLTQELLSAEDIISGMREEIVKSATGGSKIFREQVVVNEEFDWKKDLELLFQPFLDQLRDITEHPRLIEKTGSEIVYWQKRQQELQQAAENLDNNIAIIENPALKKEVQALRKSTGSRLNSAQQKLALLENELVALKTAKSPIWSTITDIFINIISEILLHFLVALLAAFLAYQAVKLLSVLIIAVLPKNKKGDHKFAHRTITVGRFLLGGIITIITYFIVLYSFAEWLLLVLSLLVIASLILGLRETLPRYLVEAKTLLNMGSIRHGERVIYNGLPWRISRLGVHTQLNNSALNGQLRVPLTEIATLSSRPSQEDEPWFPTKVGDTVLMEDGIFGIVMRQTPDMVEIQRAGSIYTYATQYFLSRRPCNLSTNGFTLFEIFGFDYQHQADITTTILQTYRRSIEEAIQDSPFIKYNTEINVEFSEAAASSLNFRVLVSFSGEAVSDYYPIKRFIQRTSVEVANREGWVIPFQQITVHHQPA